jgi:hypothetical protein
MHFGIHPWDVERLSPQELRRFVDRLQDMRR